MRYEELYIFRLQYFFIPRLTNDRGLYVMKDDKPNRAVSYICIYYISLLHKCIQDTYKNLSSRLDMHEYQTRAFFFAVC